MAPFSSSVVVPAVVVPLLSYLDDGPLASSSWGDFSGRTASLRQVAFTTAALLMAMRHTVGTWRGVEWHALLHALVVGLGAWACRAAEEYYASGGDLGPDAVMIDMSGGMSEEAVRAMSDGRRSALCLGPLTSLHRILPAFTLGYSLCDVLDSFKLGPAFLMHGLATSIVMGFFCEMGSSHIVTPMLLMELSTIWLACMRGTCYSEGAQIGVQLLFVISFFAVRILWVPRIWWDIAVEMNQTRGTEVDTCSLSTVFPVVVVFGLFFHCLNGYWFYRMILKIQRKVAGKEDKDNVDME